MKRTLELEAQVLSYGQAGRRRDFGDMATMRFELQVGSTEIPPVQGQLILTLPADTFGRLALAAPMKLVLEYETTEPEKT